MLKRKLLCFHLSLILTILFCTTPACAGQTTQELFLTGLKEKAEEVNSISSDFIQQSVISLFQDKVESKGHFTFARPDNLRWEYSEPFVSGFLIRSGRGLRWDEASTDPAPFNTSSAPEMSIISEQILAWTTMNMDWLESRYRIKVTDYDPAVMELVPRSEAAAKFMSLIRIFFSSDATHLQAIELHEPGGDYTRIDFENVKINSPLREDIFEKR